MWRQFLQRLIEFRRTMRAVYGLPLRAEIHAADFIRHKTYGLSRNVRLAVLRNALDELAKIDFISITNVLIDKQGKPQDYDVFSVAWGVLFQRFENTLVASNFPGAHWRDHGIVITDATAGQKLARMIRRMAVRNNIPNQLAYGVGYRNIPITRVIEDPHGKDSKDTLPIQMADVVAYFLMQKHRPNAYIRSQRAQLYFDRLQPVLNLRATRRHPLGIVSF